MAQWLVNIGRRQAQARIAHLLCEIGVRAKADLARPEVRFLLRMNQEQLANASGLTAVHVNRTLMALRHRGITFTASTVRVEDWRNLTEIGDFDPSYLQANVPPAERLTIVKHS
jgi:hypothetical protein